MPDFNGIGHSGIRPDQNINYSDENFKKGMVTGIELYGLELDPAELEDSLLDDAQEEVAFAKDNSKQKKLEQRKQKDAEYKTEERLKKLRESVSLSVSAKAKSQDLSDQANRPETTPDDLLRRLSEYGGHDAENYALLLEMADTETDERKASLYKNAAAKLYEAKHESIDAVLNALSVDENVVGGYTALQNAENYSDAILNFTDSFAMLDYLADKYGNDMERGIDFMNRALGADLDSAKQSHEPAFLESVAQGLGQVKFLYSCYLQGEKLLERLDSQFGFDVKNVNKTEFLRNIDKVAKTNFISTYDIRNILSKVSSSDPEKEVILCQELVTTLRSMPDQIYGSVEARGRVNEVCIRLLDEKVDAEDQWLESKQ